MLVFLAVQWNSYFPHFDFEWNFVRNEVPSGTEWVQTYRAIPNHSVSRKLSTAQAVKTVVVEMNFFAWPKTLKMCKYCENVGNWRYLQVFFFFVRQPPLPPLTLAVLAVTPSTHSNVIVASTRRHLTHRSSSDGRGRPKTRRSSLMLLHHQRLPSLPCQIIPDTLQRHLNKVRTTASSIFAKSTNFMMDF